MGDVVISLPDVEVCPVFFPFEVDLLQVEQMLVVEHVQSFYLVLNHFLLIALLLFLSVHLQLSQAPLQLCLRVSVLFDLLLELVDFMLDLNER